MGLLAKLFGLAVRCPACDTPDARDSFAGVRCRRSGCRFFDPVYAEEREQAERPWWADKDPVAFGDPVTIHYENYLGEAKQFVADRASLRRRGAHISARVQPTGMRIALKPEKIGNLHELEASLPDAANMPTPKEAHVLTYHANHGTTSPLHEELRRKYPGF